MANIGIIGAGHNGLVCAFYLAKAGHRLTIFEQASVPGGACRNEKWSSGAIISPGANHFGMLAGRIIQDMGLGSVTLPVVRADPQVLVGLDGRQSIAMYDDEARTSAEVAKYSVRDAKAVSAFFADVGSVRSVMMKHAYSLSPSLGEFGDELKSLDSRFPELYLRGSISQLLDHYFQSRESKALFSATAFLNNADPEDAGTAFSYTYLSMYDTHGQSGWGVPIGGMGRIVELMVSRLNGLEEKPTFSFGSKVAKILTENNCAVGIQLVDGSKARFDYVVSNADPFNTYVSLCGLESSHFSGLTKGCHAGPCAKFNFTFKGNANPIHISPRHSDSLFKTVYVYLPSIEYAKEAFRSACHHGYSAKPYYEFISPTQFDSSLAPQGLSIGSIYLLFSNYDVICQWEKAKRDALKEDLFFRVIKELGLNPDNIQEKDLLDPVDIETKFGMYKGNVDHGSLVPDNIFEHRQRDGSSGIQHLYLCGSGAYPGGLVSGYPGYNTARRLLRDLQT